MSIINLYDSLSDTCKSLITPIVSLAARIYVGMEFFRSGLLKLEDFRFFEFEETLEMFETDWAIPYVSPEIAAPLATLGELVLPIMLIAGIFTRLGALGLFAMALTIEIFVYPGTAQHYYWMLILGFLAANGGQTFSVDNLLLKIKS